MDGPKLKRTKAPGAMVPVFIFCPKARHFKHRDVCEIVCMKLGTCKAYQQYIAERKQRGGGNTNGE